MKLRDPFNDSEKRRRQAAGVAGSKAARPSANGVNGTIVRYNGAELSGRGALNRRSQ
jgi:hypothetical protein